MLFTCVIDITGVEKITEENIVDLALFSVLNLLAEMFSTHKVNEKCLKIFKFLFLRKIECCLNKE